MNAEEPRRVGCGLATGEDHLPYFGGLRWRQLRTTTADAALRARRFETSVRPLTHHRPFELGEATEVF
jgi:hypothetical protein